MKYIYRKFNKVFCQTENLFLRFSLSFSIVLTPFLCASILAIIILDNCLRGLVLLLLLLNAFSERTRDNKLVIAFIGLIPIGFYVVTSPLVLGWYLGTVAKDIGGIIFSNPITSVISGVSIYGLIYAAKKTSSIYEWFVNTWSGSWLFPEYNNLKKELSLKNQTILELVKSNQEALQRENKTANELANSTTLLLQIKNVLKDIIEHPIIQKTKEHFRISDNHLRHFFLTIPADPKVKPIAELHNDITDLVDLSKDQIDTNKKRLTEHIEPKKETSLLLNKIQEQPDALIPVPESVLNIVQKIFAGILTIITIEGIHQLNTSDFLYIKQGYNLLYEYLGPKGAITLTTMGTALSIILTGEMINGVLTFAKNTYKETRALFENGIKHVTKQITSGEVPNISQNVVKLDIFKAVPPENLKVELLETLKEIEKAQKIPDTTTINPTKGRFRHPIFNVHSTFIKEGIQDVPLVRKPGFRDFLEVKASSKSVNTPLPVITSPITSSTILSKEKIKSITWSLPD